VDEALDNHGPQPLGKCFDRVAQVADLLAAQHEVFGARTLITDKIADGVRRQVMQAQ
jgi:hypothetical protein